MAAIAGGAIAVAALAFLVYEAAWGDQGPPAIRVDVIGIAVVDAGYRVQFRAANDGGRTAEAVVVEGVLLRGGEIVERAHVTLDAVAGKSTRGGGLFFSRDPSSARLVVRAMGYQQP